MQTAGISAGEWTIPTDNFSTEYRYDYNGNILSLQRKDANAQIMHHINYAYNAKNNRLQGITATGINSSNYTYDAIGNLSNDNGENISVTWNAMNKVKQVNLPNNRQLQFSYNPTGQRQIKKSNDKTEYYLHDATGNIMCVYELSGNYLTVKERTIYGSKRIGVYRQRIRFGISSSFIQVPGTGLINILHPQLIISPDGRHYLEGSNRLQVIGANQRIVSNTTMPYSYKKGTPELKGLSPLMATRPTFLDGTKSAGLRDYELTDHLSNVMAVISDRKLSVDTNYDNITDYYSSQMVSYTDYYPFGFPMVERSGNLSGYRFGFNGQEGDNEVYGVKTTYAFEARLYNSILGRWFSPEPLRKEYSNISSYAFVSNSPIYVKDIGGKYGVIVIKENCDADGNVISRTATLKMNYYYNSSETYTGGYGSISKENANTIINNIRENLNSLVGQFITIEGEEYTFNYEIQFIDLAEEDGRPMSQASYDLYKGEKIGNYMESYTVSTNNSNESLTGEYEIGRAAEDVLAIDFVRYNQYLSKKISDGQTPIHELLHNIGRKDTGKSGTSIMDKFSLESGKRSITIEDIEKAISSENDRLKIIYEEN